MFRACGSRKGVWSGSKPARIPGGLLVWRSKSSQVNILPKAKSKTRSKQNKIM